MPVPLAGGEGDPVRTGYGDRGLRLCLMGDNPKLMDAWYPRYMTSKVASNNDNRVTAQVLLDLAG